MTTVHLLKRVMDGLGLSQDEARIYLDTMQLTCRVEDLIPDDASVAATVWRKCIGGHNHAAVAGQYSMVHIRNWPGSGVLVVVDRILAWTGTAGEIEIWEDVTGYGTLVTTKGFRNQSIAGLPVAQIRTDDNAAHQGDVQIGDVAGAAFTPVEILGPFVLDGGAAGQAIGVEGNAVNVVIGAHFEWRERDWNPAA